MFIILFSVFDRRIQEESIFRAVRCFFNSLFLLFKVVFEYISLRKGLIFLILSIIRGTAGFGGKGVFF